MLLSYAETPISSRHAVPACDEPNKTAVCAGRSLRLCLLRKQFKTSVAVTKLSSI